MTIMALARNNVIAATTMSDGTDIAAQQSLKKVSGIVVDNSGKPVVGATIVIKGSTIGTISGADGKFTLNISVPSIG